MKKNDYERKMIEITENLLDNKKLIENKVKRQNEIKELLLSNIKNKEKKRLKEELSYIDSNEKIKEIVKSNYTKNFLTEIKERKNSVLVIGINPSGGNTQTEFKEKVEAQIYFLPKENLTEEECNKLNVLNNNYVFIHGYHSENFKLFDKIKAKPHWSQTGYLSDEEVKKMLVNCKVDANESAEIIRIIRKLQVEEQKKDGPFVFFSDLFWYNCGNQEELKKAIIYKDNFNEEILKMIKLNIEYYKPKLIVVTNAFASNLIENAVNNKNVENHTSLIYLEKIPILLASMVSGKRSMDNYSKDRLKIQIKTIYENQTKK